MGSYWESDCGLGGVDQDSFIDSLYKPRHKPKRNYDDHFDTFKDACEWARKKQGRAIQPSILGGW